MAYRCGLLSTRLYMSYSHDHSRGFIRAPLVRTPQPLGNAQHEDLVGRGHLVRAFTRAALDREPVLGTAADNAQECS